MSWKDELQPASIGGVPVHVRERRGAAGRRYELHEYPKRDTGWAEDMGGHHGPQTFEAFVIGADHFSQRDNLIDVLNKEGPTTLVHPSRGTMQVQIGECPWTESTREGGMTTFTINFVLAGERQYPVAQVDTVGRVETTVNSGLTALQTDVNSRFNISGLPGWVATSANEWIQKGFDQLQPFTDSVSIASNLGRTISGIQSNLTLLMSTPDAMATQLSDVMVSLFGDTSFDGAQGMDQARAVQRTLSDQLAAAKTAETIPLTTPSRQQQAANRDALIELFTVSVSLLTAQTIVQASQAVGVETNEQSPFDSYDHAIAIRDEQLQLLDDIANTASDDLYLAIRDLQTDLINHINAHGYQLERVASYSPVVEMPALIIAHLLYGDATRETDIVRRNNVRHPGFTPAGDPLEVLQAVSNG